MKREKKKQYKNGILEFIRELDDKEAFFDINDIGNNLQVIDPDEDTELNVALKELAEEKLLMRKGDRWKIHPDELERQGWVKKKAKKTKEAPVKKQAQSTDKKPTPLSQKAAAQIIADSKASMPGAPITLDFVREVLLSADEYDIDDDVLRAAFDSVVADSNEIPAQTTFLTERPDLLAALIQFKKQYPNELDPKDVEDESDVLDFADQSYAALDEKQKRNPSKFSTACHELFGSINQRPIIPAPGDGFNVRLHSAADNKHADDDSNITDVLAIGARSLDGNIIKQAIVDIGGFERIDVDPDEYNGEFDLDDDLSIV